MNDADTTIRDIPESKIWVPKVSLAITLGIKSTDHTTHSVILVR